MIMTHEALTLDLNTYLFSFVCHCSLNLFIISLLCFCFFLFFFQLWCLAVGAVNRGGAVPWNRRPRCCLRRGS